MATPDPGSHSLSRDPAGTASLHLARHLTLVNPEPQLVQVPGVFLERPELEKLKKFHALLWHYMVGWKAAAEWRLRCRQLRSGYLEQVADRAKEASYWTGVEDLLRARGLRAALPQDLLDVLPPDKGGTIDEFEHSLVEAMKKVQLARTPQEGADLTTIAYDVRNFVIVMEQSVEDLADDFEQRAGGVHGESTDWVLLMLDRLDRRADEAPQAELPDKTKMPEDAEEGTVALHEPGSQAPKTPELRIDMEAIRQAFGLGGFTARPDVAAHRLTSSFNPGGRTHD